MAERLFGTDGIRGRAGEGWLSDDSVSALGAAVGRVLGTKAGPKTALVGHDGRASGPQLEAALARGLAQSGFEVTSTGLTTTPGLAWLGGSNFDLAVMISASHNPASDNGIKIFQADGEKLADEVEDRIEAELRAHPEGISEGPPARYAAELEESYLDHLTSSAPGLSLAGRVIALDAANGGGSHIGPALLTKLGAQIVPVACAPDGTNINTDCGSTHPEALQRAVKEHGAEVGIALDGDGDRCILVDERGELIDGDGIMTIIARHASKRKLWSDPRMVATVMSNRGMHRAMRDAGIEVVTVGVGDRRVVEALRREGLPLGGEQSGHVVFGADNRYIGDGLYTALRVLAVMAEENAPLSKLAAAFQPYPQVLINVKVAEKPPLEELPGMTSAVERVEEELAGEGRVLLRYSGTESLARVMVEGPDPDHIRASAEGIVELIRGEIGA